MDGASRGMKKIPWRFNIGTFQKPLLITSPKRFGVRVSKAINLERLNLKGRNRQAPPKGNLKPFGGFT